MQLSRGPSATVAAAGSLVVVVGCLALRPGTWGWAAALVASLSAVGIAWRDRNPATIGSDAARAFLGSVIGGGLIIPAGIGVLVSGVTLLQEVSISEAGRLAFLLALAGWLTGLWLAWRPMTPKGSAWFAALALATVAAARLAYVLAVDVEPMQDFKRLWLLACNADSLWPAGIPSGPAMAAELGTNETVLAFYRQRVWLYFLPLRLLFGSAATSFLVANALLTTAMSGVVYWLASTLYSRRAGRLALLVSLLAVEPTVAAAISTHDIPGTAFTLLALALIIGATLRLLQTRAWAALLLAGLFGFAASLTQLQRSTGLLLVASGGLAAAVAFAADPRATPRVGRRLIRSVAVLLLVPLCSYQIAAAFFASQSLSVPSTEFHQRRGLRLAAGTTLWSDGTWSQYFNDFEARYGKVEGSWYDLTAARLATESRVLPLARLGTYARKSRSLFALGSQLYFYLHNPKIAGDPSQATRLGHIANAANALAAMVLLGGMAVGLVRLLRAPARLFGLIPAFFLAALAGVLILCNETQPRYIFPVWYVGALYAGVGLAGGAPEASRRYGAPEAGPAQADPG